MASTINFGQLNAGIQIGVSNALINNIQLLSGKSTPRYLVVPVDDDDGARLIPHIAAPERPETPSEPLSTVLFLLDTDFVDRGTLLEKVEEKCIVRPSRLALVGIGGVGWNSHETLLK
jgi:hypothetical protein